MVFTPFGGRLVDGHTSALTQVSVMKRGEVRLCKVEDQQVLTSEIPAQRSWDASHSNDCDRPLHSPPGEIPTFADPASGVTLNFLLRYYKLRGSFRLPLTHGMSSPLL